MSICDRSCFLCIVMGRRKQLRPHRSGRIVEKHENAGHVLDEQNASEKAQNDEVVDVEAPLFVEVDSSSWGSMNTLIFQKFF